MHVFRDSRPNLVRFLALIPVTADEAAAFADYQGFVVWGLRESITHGIQELALEVSAQDEQQARERVVVIFSNWLERAGIRRDEPPDVTLLEPDFMQRQRWFELRMLAKDLHQHGDQHELAVIVAQTACEVLVEAAVADLIRRRNAPLADPLGDLLGGTASWMTAAARYGAR